MHLITLYGGLSASPYLLTSGENIKLSLVDNHLSKHYLHIPFACFEKCKSGIEYILGARFPRQRKWAASILSELGQKPTWRGHVEMGRDGYDGGDQETECGELGRGEAGWGVEGREARAQRPRWAEQ